MENVLQEASVDTHLKCCVTVTLYELWILRFSGHIKSEADVLCNNLSNFTTDLFFRKSQKQAAPPQIIIIIFSILSFFFFLNQGLCLFD